MHWTDTAIVLSIRKHGENSAIIRVLSRNHGVYGGMIRGVHSKANRGILQPGNIVNATWQARLSEHLGTFKCELLEAHAAFIMQDSSKLMALTSACTLMESALPERHPYSRLYAVFQSFLNSLSLWERAGVRADSLCEIGPHNHKNGPHPDPHPEGEGIYWQEAYVWLELEILTESGFGLDLSECAATGVTQDLIYVSPKSGRAVSREAGEPYKDRLLALPQFLLPPPPVAGRVGEGVSQRRKPNRHGSHALISNARELRQNMPEAEKQLWYHLRAHRLENFRFRRQHPVSPYYIADFICLDRKLVIELDGGQHSEQDADDAERTAYLEKEGYQVLRFRNNEVLGNMEGVLTVIVNTLQATPSPALPPSGGGGSKEILAGLHLTGYFLDHWLLAPHNWKLPAVRKRLVQTLQEGNNNANNTN